MAVQPESTIGDALLESLRAHARAIRPAPAALVLFGSVARGDAGPDSDLDVLAVRPTTVAWDDDAYADALIDWQERAWDLTGRPVGLIEAEEAEVPDLLARAGSVWQDIASEGSS